ncbi:MAG: RNA polymerase sigma factor [Duncaniella sp.]|nr:RNA polymerase sigma factor [Duncaniella sp.]
MKTNTLTASFMALREKLHRSALGFLKNDEDAKDAMQDTFFNLWRSGGADTESEARNKLFAVLKNICIDKLRKPRTIGIDDINPEGLIEDPSPWEDIKKYESLLTSGLTDIQRRIYSLVTHEGMEYDAIASHLNMSVEAVRMNMSRARKKIRDNYKLLENENARR